MYVFAIFKLPFCLYLQDKLYELVVPELNISDKVLVLLSKFRREKEKIDYVTFWRAELVNKGELWNDRNGIFRRTSATLLFPASVLPLKRDTAETSYYDELPQIIDVSLKILNRLVSIYRYVTGDTYIPLLQAEDINNYFEVGDCEIALDGSISGHGRVSGFDARLTNTISDYDENIHLEIKRWISTIDPLPLHEEFIMNARFFLQEGNWRASVIEVQTAFEVCLSDIIRKYYTTKGYSPTHIDRIMNCGLANLIKSHLPKAVGKLFASGEANYDQWYKNTYLMRNRVVHGGYSPSEQEAIQGVLGVEYALEYLVARPKEKIWPKKKPSTVVNEFVVP